MQVRETTVDGRPTRYRVAGGGEPLVLVHGLAGSWRWWLPLVDLLRAQRRVHVVQLPRFRQHVAVTDVSDWLGRWADAAGIGPGHVPMLEVPETLAEAMLAFLGEELADDSRDELRPREVDGVGLGRDDDEPAAR